MTAENMARYRGDPNYDFWKMLKEGYDHFEITKVPPKVDVCEGRYVFNRIAPPDHAFSPTDACPPTTQPESLQMAYRTYQNQFEAAFSSALNSRRFDDPRPSIRGMKEASLVADWSRRRARGERVSSNPPSLESVAVAKTESRESSPRTTATAITAAIPATPTQPEARQQQTAEAKPQPAATARSDAPAVPGEGAAAVETAASPVPLPSPNPGREARTAPASEKTTVSRILSLFGG